MKINLAVLFGGRSVEHEVSIISAVQAMTNLDTNKYQILPVYISKTNQLFTGPNLMVMSAYRDVDALLATCSPAQLLVDDGRTWLASAPAHRWAKPQRQVIDVALPIVHGTGGEDGSLQGWLTMLNLPFAGPDVLGSAVGMDKAVEKALLRAAGLPVLPELLIHRGDDWSGDVVTRAEDAFAYPMIVKPANLGSSIGISKAQDRDQLLAGLELAFSFAERVMIEPMVSNLREINCAVLGNLDRVDLSECEEPIMTDDILSFRDKYVGGTAAKGGKSAGAAASSAGAKQAESAGMASLKRLLPAPISPTQRSQIQSLAKETFCCLGLEGVTRVDFLMDGVSGQIWINEVNTIPGSLAFYLFEPVGLPYPALLDRLVELAMARFRRQQDVTLAFDSNILAGAAIGGSKGAKSAS
ncbi:MAG: D-alanine--D-alanine ligase [Propionibacteriaceae bacterium]|nr:D-alanine--D-alanine ligase [Propionibacteriaceae bacterium]